MLVCAFKSSSIERIGIIIFRRRNYRFFGQSGKGEWKLEQKLYDVMVPMVKLSVYRVITEGRICQDSASTINEKYTTDVEFNPLFLGIVVCRFSLASGVNALKQYSEHAH